MPDTGLFYQYLFQFHRLPLSGIGEIILKINPATLRMLDKEISPPTYHFEFSSLSGDDRHLISWLSNRLSVSLDKAEYFAKDYINNIKRIVIDNGRYEWKHIGEWMSDSSGLLTFTGFDISLHGQDVIPAEKLIRNQPSHKVLIGDQIYSGDQVHQLLEKNKKRSFKIQYYIVLASFIILTLSVALFCLINIPGFRFFHQAHSKLKVKPNMETYQIINSD